MCSCLCRRDIWAEVKHCSDCGETQHGVHNNNKWLKTRVVLTPSRALNPPLLELHTLFSVRPRAEPRPKSVSVGLCLHFQREFWKDSDDGITMFGVRGMSSALFEAARNDWGPWRMQAYWHSIRPLELAPFCLWRRTNGNHA